MLKNRESLLQNINNVKFLKGLFSFTLLIEPDYFFFTLLLMFCQDSVSIVGRTYIIVARGCKETTYEDTLREKINKKYSETFSFVWKNKQRVRIIIVRKKGGFQKL